MALESKQQNHILKKARQLSEYIPNLVIMDGKLIVEANPLHLGIALVLEARKKC